MSRPVLHYFNGHGRGEVIRLLFIHHKVDFEDHRITFEEWPAIKATGISEFGQLPMLEIDGLKLVQTMAILHYLADKYGYMPNSPALRYRMDSTVDLVGDYIQGMAQHFYVAKDMEAVAKYYNENAPRFLGFFNARLLENHEGNGWFVGETVTLTDFVLFEFFWDFFFRPSMVQFAHFFDQYPQLKAYFDRVLSSSTELTAYYSARPESQF